MASSVESKTRSGRSCTREWSAIPGLVERLALANLFVKMEVAESSGVGTSFDASTQVAMAARSAPSGMVILNVGGPGDGWSEREAQEASSSSAMSREWSVGRPPSTGGYVEAAVRAAPPLTFTSARM